MTAAVRALIARALVYAGGTHSVDDVAAAIKARTMQLWPMPHSVMVTEILTYPRCKMLNVFLAAGVMAEIEAMTPVMLDWARGEGCTSARCVGRRGWARSFMTRTGWTVGDSVFLETQL